MKEFNCRWLDLLLFPVCIWIWLVEALKSTCRLPYCGIIFFNGNLFFHLRPSFGLAECDLKKFPIFEKRYPYCWYKYYLKNIKRNYYKKIYHHVSYYYLLRVMTSLLLIVLIVESNPPLFRIPCCCKHPSSLVTVPCSKIRKCTWHIVCKFL